MNFLQPYQIGPLNALKKLDIRTVMVIEDDKAIHNMKLPNLRYLELSQKKWVRRPVFGHFYILITYDKFFLKFYDWVKVFFL
jgi:hypothetical protein